MKAVIENQGHSTKYWFLNSSEVKTVKILFKNEYELFFALFQV